MEKMDDLAEISNIGHKTDLMNTFKNFVNADTFTDVQLISQEGKKVYAHKLILSAVSELMKRILKDLPDCKEMITIHLPDISYKMLRLVTNFIYIGYMNLNNKEMEQFKSVMGLLGIEMFELAKNDDGTSSGPSSSRGPSSSTGILQQAVNPVPMTNSSTGILQQVANPVPNADIYYNRNSSETKTNWYVNPEQPVTPDYMAMPQTSSQIPGSQMMVHSGNTTVLQPTDPVLQQLQATPQYPTITNNILSSNQSIKTDVRQAVPSNCTNILPVNSIPNIGQLPVNTKINIPNQSPGSSLHQLPVQGIGGGHSEILRIMQPQPSRPPIQSGVQYATPPLPLQGSHEITGVGTQIVNTVQRTSQHQQLSSRTTCKRSKIVIDLSDDDKSFQSTSQGRFGNHHLSSVKPVKRIKTRTTMSDEIIDLD